MLNDWNIMIMNSLWFDAKCKSRLLLNVHILHEVGGMANMLRRSMGGLYRIDVGLHSQVGQADRIRKGCSLSCRVSAYAKCPRRHRYPVVEPDECGRCRLTESLRLRRGASFAMYAHSWQPDPRLVASFHLGVSSSSRGAPYEHPASPHLFVLSDTVWILRYSSSSWRCISKST
jgi:hypothetical protein